MNQIKNLSFIILVISLSSCNKKEKNTKDEIPNSDMLVAHNRVDNVEQQLAKTLELITGESIDPLTIRSGNNQGGGHTVAQYGRNWRYHFKKSLNVSESKRLEAFKDDIISGNSWTDARLKSSFSLDLKHDYLNVSLYLTNETK